MPNTIEAAEMMEEAAIETEKLIASMEKLKEELGVRGRDTAELKGHIKALRDIRDQNLNTANYIRATAE